MSSAAAASKGRNCGRWQPWRAARVRRGSGLDPYADVYRDDQLRLVFTCCHPALPLAGRVALTLKDRRRPVDRADRSDLPGAAKPPWDSGCCVPETRSPHTGIRLQVPEPPRLAERTAGVLAVIYLIFTEATRPRRARRPSIWRPRPSGSAELLTRLLPHEAEAHGLHALLLLAACPPVGANQPRGRPDPDGRAGP